MSKVFNQWNNTKEYLFGGQFRHLYLQWLYTYWELLLRYQKTCCSLCTNLKFPLVNTATQCLNSLKALDKYKNCQRQVFPTGVSKYLVIGSFGNRSGNKQIPGGKITLVLQECVCFRILTNRMLRGSLFIIISNNLPLSQKLFNSESFFTILYTINSSPLLRCSLPSKFVCYYYVIWLFIKRVKCL